MTRLAVILGALALVAAAGSAQAGLPEGPPDVHTDGDSRCNISDDGNSSTGSCCVGNDDGSISCVVETVTSIPSADFKIPPRRKFPPYVFGAKPSFPPEPTYLNRSHWSFGSTTHVQRPLRFDSSMVAHPPEPTYKFGSSVINRAALASHAAFASHVSFASHAAVGRSSGRLR